MQILKENSNIGAFDLIKKTLSVIICLCDFQKNEANSALAYLNEVTKVILHKDDPHWGSLKSEWFSPQEWKLPRNSITGSCFW
jgi:hypothetical protein